MTSYGNMMPMAAPRPGQSYGAPMAVHHHAQAAPAGTFAPGTKIQVGDHRVVIQKYLSEGGFAHVYLVKLPRPVDGTDLAVLKRVAVPDKETLRGMRTEVETMKRLKGHRPIVTYIDSHASELRGGGFEVFLLMEYCNGGGLIDFMNTRLQNRLTEPEILQIFTDVAEGVACMHYLKPPLLHRDLKVENVLITMVGSKRKFKLCDFGSSAPPRPAPQTVVECRLMDEDVQKHTTLQYRSPEMIDVYRKLPIDEKSDIWALGVLLYKLCYYTTPFEDQGQLAILNASYRFPSYPVFSDRLKHLIASMLRESPSSRPTIYQVLREACNMQGRDVPIQDIYSTRSQSEPRRTDKQPLSRQKGSSTPTPIVGAVFAPPARQQQVIPEVVPMRRGRPPAASSHPPVQANKPSPSPMRVTTGDPFAALDTKTGSKFEQDELSSRFPTLDQFSILLDQGAKFDFDSQKSPEQTEFSQKVAERLADEAFAMPQMAPAASTSPQRQPIDLNRVRSVANTTELGRHSPQASINKPASAPPKSSEMSRASAIISSNPELQAIAATPVQSAESTASRPSMVSIGTMTDVTPPPERQPRDYPPIYRFPPADHRDRSASSPRLQETTGTGQRPAAERVPSYQLQSTQARYPSSSRPSLEGRRPSLDSLEPISKSRSTSGRPRPASTYLESNLDYLREKEKEGASKPLRSPGLHGSPLFGSRTSSPRIEAQDDKAIESNVEFLRSMEDSDKKKERGSKHGKRSSLNSLSGTKNKLAGKFGDAFKRFEGGHHGGPPSPSVDDLEHRTLTPIAGSEATDGRSEDGRLLGDQEELTPEMRRELEARALAEEERRVEAAAAEYRQRVAARGTGGGSGNHPRATGGASRAISIQARVQNLLDESQKATPHKTAEGYGHFSDNATAASRVDKQLSQSPPKVARKPIGIARGTPAKPVTTSVDVSARARQATMPTSVVSDTSSSTTASRPVKPSAPPKPTHLANIPTGGRRSPLKQTQVPSQSANEQLVGVGLPGRPVLEMSAQDKEDYIRDFQKRYPSLGSIEMVERDLGSEGGGRR